jgi:hypothetical protein
MFFLNWPANYQVLTLTMISSRSILPYLRQKTVTFQINCKDDKSLLK